MSEHCDFEQTTVPDHQRRGFWSMFAVMLGFTFFSASMWTGANLGSGLTLTNFWIAVLAGNLILGVYTAILAWIAGSTGLSIHLLSRYAFGRFGSGLPSALLAITQIGWFGVGIAMFADPVQTFLKANGCNCNIWIPIIIAGVLMTSSAYWGIKALTVVSVIAVPAIAIGGGFSAIKVFADNPDAWNTLRTFTPDQGKALTLSAAIALTVGSFISGGTCTPDFVRFDNALYTSGLGLSNITGFPKRYIVLFNGLLGTVLALYLYNNFCGYLSMLNTFIPPVGAVLAADFFVIRKCGRKYEPLEALKDAPKISFAAVVAWAAGGAVAFLTTKWGISAINGMVTSAIIYIVLKKLFPKA